MMVPDVCHLPRDRQVEEAARAGNLASGTPFTRCGLTWPPGDWPNGDGWVSTAAQYVGANACPACFPEVVHVAPATTDVCEVHDWPTDGLARRLIDAMRERHGKGGVNACVDCIARARASLPPRPVP
jgi:hypothetical protein